MPKDPDPALGQAIYELRQDLHITQLELAAAASLAVGVIARLEQGETNPTWATVRRLAAACQVTVAELADRADQLRTG